MSSTYPSLKSRKSDLYRFVSVDDCNLAGEGCDDMKPLAFPAAFIHNMPEMTIQEIAYVIADRFFNGDLPSTEIKQAVASSINFPVPLKLSDDRTRADVDLSQGPSGSTKDYIVGFLISILKCELNLGLSLPVNLLLATTQDMCNAIAESIKSLDGVNVFAICPSGNYKFGRVYSKNVHRIEVRGGLKQCRDILAAIKKDSEICDEFDIIVVMPESAIMRMASAVPFFWTYAQLASQIENIENYDIDFRDDFSGGLDAAIQMGLPIGKLTHSTKEGTNVGCAKKTDPNSNCRIEVSFNGKQSRYENRNQEAQPQLNYLASPVSPTVSAVKNRLIKILTEKISNHHNS